MNLTNGSTLLLIMTLILSSSTRILMGQVCPDEFNNVWTGDASSQWSDPANWSTFPGRAPEECDHVIFHTGEPTIIDHNYAYLPTTYTAGIGSSTGAIILSLAIEAADPLPPSSYDNLSFLAQSFAPRTLLIRGDAVRAVSNPTAVNDYRVRLGAESTGVPHQVYLGDPHSVPPVAGSTQGFEWDIGINS